MAWISGIWRWIAESEWCGDLREELAVTETWLEQVAAFGRVTSRYVARIAFIAVAAIGVVLLIVLR